MKKISFKLDERSISSAVQEVRELERRMDKKLDELMRRLALLGATSASVGFSRAAYSGKRKVDISVEKRGNGYAILAEGESVLFIEFGAGARYGYGHPQNKEFGMGPGTYPLGKSRKDSSGNLVPNWRNPNGWWIPKEAGGGHTYGNPPAMVMYRTARELEREIKTIVEEVFRDP